jgi:hypothetical protein
MEIGQTYIFQVDSKIVKEVYADNKNYKIEYNQDCSDQSTCAIYFSSNNIYFPNEEDIFKKRIIEKDNYEWYQTRIENAYKHIFIRDIQKQWYLEGINAEINSPEKLFHFLEKETKGYSIITLGSSAGGYAAVLFGSMLKADKILSFNGQMMLEDLLENSSEEINPLVFRNKDKLEYRQYYSLRAFLKNSAKQVYYFCSQKSDWDYQQFLHVKDQNVNFIFFDTHHHGIPFLKIALNKVLHLNYRELNRYSRKKNHPIIFSIKQVGLIKIFRFLFDSSIKKMKRK